MAQWNAETAIMKEQLDAFNKRLVETQVNTTQIVRAGIRQIRQYYGLADSVLSILGFNIDATTRSIIQAAMSGAETLAPLLTAQAALLSPAAKVQAFLGLANVGLAIAAAYRARVGLETDSDARNMIQDISSLLGGINY